MTEGVTAIFENADYEVVAVADSCFEFAARSRSNPSQLWALKCVEHSKSFTPTDLEEIINAGAKMGLLKTMIIGLEEFNEAVKKSAENPAVQLVDGHQYRQRLRPYLHKFLPSSQEM